MSFSSLAYICSSSWSPTMVSTWLTSSLMSPSSAMLSCFLVFFGWRLATDSRNTNSLQAFTKMLLAASEREMPSTCLPMLFSRPTRGV